MIMKTNICANLYNFLIFISRKFMQNSKTQLTLRFSLFYY